MPLTEAEFEQRLEDFMHLVYEYDLVKPGHRAMALDEAIRAQFKLALLDKPVRIVKE